MKFHKLALLGLPLVLFGCPEDDKDDSDTDDTDPATDTDTEDTDLPTPPPELEVSVELSVQPHTVTVTLTNATEAYEFGMAQTAVEAAGGSPWYGEDCFNGTGGFNFCHNVGMTGATLTGVSTPDEVVEGATTLIPGDSPPLTYILIGVDSGDCWVWGDDISYYAGYNNGDDCQEYMAPM